MEEACEFNALCTNLKRAFSKAEIPHQVGMGIASVTALKASKSSAFPVSYTCRILTLIFFFQMIKPDFLIPLRSQKIANPPAKPTSHCQLAGQDRTLTSSGSKSARSKSSLGLSKLSLPIASLKKRLLGCPSLCEPAGTRKSPTQLKSSYITEAACALVARTHAFEEQVQGRCCCSVCVKLQ